MDEFMKKRLKIFFRLNYEEIKAVVVAICKLVVTVVAIGLGLLLIFYLVSSLDNWIDLIIPLI